MMAITPKHGASAGKLSNGSPPKQPLGAFIRGAGVAWLCAMAVALPAQAAHAACKKGALGTHRTLEVKADEFRVFNGTEKSLGLRDKEIVLTFDDGPSGGNTSRILKALEKECVKATFFFVGRMARGNPKLVRKVVKQGHTLAHHTHAHEHLPSYNSKQASRIVDRGVRGLQKIAYGEATADPKTPFFRYPYLARTKRTDRILARKGLVAFGANIDSMDWKLKSSKAIRKHIMRQVKRERRGIVLMHDIHARTAKMLPSLLRSLKAGGYKIVHLVPEQDGTVAKTQKPVAVGSASRSGRAKVTRRNFRYLKNREIARLSAADQKLYWTRYWYVKRGLEIPKRLR